MADVTWPLGLPQQFQQKGYSEGNTDNVLRSKNNTGPPKRRLRSSVAQLPITGNMLLSNFQKGIFSNFYTDDAKYGSLSVDFPDPNDPGNYVEVFINSKNLTPVSGNTWQLALQLTALY